MNDAEFPLHTPEGYQAFLDHNAAEQARREAEPTYHEPPWYPTGQEIAAARGLADQARARQQAEAEAEAADPELEAG